MKACICRRSASGIGHRGREGVARFVPVDRAGVGASGFTVYITPCVGRGDISPTSTRIVYVGGSVPKCVTASLATASARSLP